MILAASHITKGFGSDDILRDASLLVNAREKVAVVGNNGAGKTTLLDILTGTTTPDDGTVSLAAGATIGYLRQINDISGTQTMLEEMTRIIAPILEMEQEMLQVQEEMKNASGSALEALYERYNRLLHNYEQADGYSAKSRVVGILKGLGFTEQEFSKQVNYLSGGEKTRLFLGKILLSRPDIIFLDEPTNHLDLSGIEWLETYLMNYPGTVILVSHDRYFLDRIVNKVVDVDRGMITTYEGNYSQYAVKKKAQYDALLKAYEKQQSEIRHQEAVIEKLQSFNREKSIKRAESRKKVLDRMERIDRPQGENPDMRLFFTQTILSGKDVLRVDDISKTFSDGATLFQNLSFELKRGEHVAIIGDNGTGKTTILKIINGLIEPDSGSVTLGTGVEIAYFDQEHQVLDQSKTIFDEIQDAYPELNNTQVRDTLAAFLFTGDDVWKRISDLSGGEVGRVSLAKLMLSKANFLILDEPTNHLDMISREILEQAVAAFEGTVLYVSHDRYFINRTATRILNLTHEKLLNYIGNYDYYLEKKDAVETYHKIGESVMAEVGIPSAGAENWKLAKQKAAEKKKRMAKIDRLEEQIRELEERLQAIEEQFEDPSVQIDSGKLGKLQKEKERLEQEMEELLAAWEELLSEEVE